MVGDSERPGRAVWAWAVGMAAFTVLSRVLPRVLLPPEDRQFVLWNLMPVAALALFCGSRLRGAWSFVVPLASMLVADLLLIVPLAKIGQPSFTWMTPVVYASFAASAWIGHAIGRHSLSPVAIGSSALLASVPFFVLTNFAVWLGGDGGDYPKTLAGLDQCYVAAVPFFRNTLLGDLLFTALFFGSHALAVRAAGAGEARATA
jgi:hypothetical protein